MTRRAASLEALVAEAGGYFQSAQVEGGSLRDQNAARYGNYVIRLPEENFSAFLDQSGTLAMWSGAPRAART